MGLTHLQGRGGSGSRQQTRVASECGLMRPYGLDAGRIKVKVKTYLPSDNFRGRSPPLYKGGPATD